MDGMCIAIKHCNTKPADSYRRSVGAGLCRQEKTSIVNHVKMEALSDVDSTITQHANHRRSGKNGLKPIAIVEMVIAEGGNIVDASSILPTR